MLETHKGIRRVVRESQRDKKERKKKNHERKLRGGKKRKHRQEKKAYDIYVKAPLRPVVSAHSKVAPAKREELQTERELADVML